VAEVRHAVHAYLSERACSAWTSLAEENGVSKTGVLEAIGNELADELDGAGFSPEWDLRVREARRIDASRRRRGGNR
jgi:hypothetical protein